MQEWWWSPSYLHFIQQCGPWKKTDWFWRKTQDVVSLLGQRNVSSGYTTINLTNMFFSIFQKREWTNSSHLHIMDNNIHLHFCPRVMLILQPFVITLFLLYWTVNKTGLYSEKRYHSYFLMLFTIQTSLEWQFRRKVVGVCSQDVQKHKVEKIVPNSELCRVEGTGLQREHQVINSKTSAELQLWLET